MKYKKKPVVIEAWLISNLCKDSANDFWNLPAPILHAYEHGQILFKPEGLTVKTLEGWMDGNLTDWLIRGVKGELYPCKPDIFILTYEEEP